MTQFIDLPIDDAVPVGPMESNIVYVNQVDIEYQLTEPMLMIGLRSTAGDQNGDGVIVGEVDLIVSTGEAPAELPPTVIAEMVAKDQLVQEISAGISQVLPQRNTSEPAVVALRSGGMDEVLLGGRGNDGLHAGTGNDLLIGRGGDDNLRGGAGKDQIRGGPGNDHLDGGFDVDVLIGGSGRDVYRVGIHTVGALSSTGDVISPDLIRGFDVRRDRLALPAEITRDMLRFSGPLVMARLAGQTLPLCELVGLDADALASQIEIVG